MYQINYVHKSSGEYTHPGLRIFSSPPSLRLLYRFLTSAGGAVVILPDAFPPFSGDLSVAAPFAAGAFEGEVMGTDAAAAEDATGADEATAALIGEK